MVQMTGQYRLLPLLLLYLYVVLLRNLHPNLRGGLRRFPQGAQCGLHVEEGGHGLHPRDDHHRELWRLDHDHQDHDEEHPAQVQVGTITLIGWGCVVWCGVVTDL